MADPIEINYEKLAEAIAKANAAASRGPGGPRPGLSGKSTEELIKEINGLMRGFQDGRSKVSKFNDMMKGAQKSVLTIDHFGQELKALDDAIASSTDTAETSALQEKKRELQRAVAHNNNIATLQNFAQEMRKVAGSGLQGAGNFVKGLQSGGSGIELASGLMSTAADMAGQTTQALGGAMGTAGQTMMASTNPKLKALGAIASVAGPLIGQAGQAASQLAKFGIEVLSKEVEKTVKAFHDASSSGAMFADGMTGLRNTANAAGLTVDQFAGVLKEKSDVIASAGMGVTEGAKRIGAAMNAGGTQMKTQLQKLGFGFEEQAGLVADTMSIMRQSGKAALPPATVAAETQKYAENLRTISAITGEDAKKKMAQVKEQANQLAFQQKLAKMEPEQRAAAIRAMANMSDIERKNFMDMVNFGTVINKEGATAQAMSAGLTDSVNESYRAFQEGKLDDVRQREISAKHAEAIKNDLLGNEALAQAGAAGVGGIVQSLSESLGKELQYRNIVNEDSIRNAEAGVQAQKNATDKLTESVVGAEQAAQNLKLSLEQTLTPAIAKFAEVSKAMLGEVQAMLKKLGIESGGEEKKKEDKGWFGNTWDKIKKGFTEDKWLSKGLNTAGGVAMVGGAVASTTGVGAIGGIPLATIGAVSSGLGMLADALGFAKGGVATGPDSGYLTKLHGNELIVPLNEDGGVKAGTEGLEGLKKLMPGADSMMAGMGLDKLLPSMPDSKSMGSMFGGVLSGLTNVAQTAMKATPVGAMASGLTDFLSQKPAEDDSESIDLMKEQIQLLKDMLDKHERLISVMSTNVSTTERLYHSMN